jgi:hypothetical protein
MKEIGLYEFVGVGGRILLKRIFRTLADVDRI